LKPRLGLAWLHFGQLLERTGRAIEAADCYQKALANPGQSLAGLLELAGFCQSRGWHEAAATNYVAAIKRDPANAELHVGAGQNLTALGRHADAVRHSAEAVRLVPDFAEARLLHGLVLGRQGHIPEATEQFREALRLKPELLDARLNLAIALINHEPAEALALFEEVLRQSPTNTTARRFVQQLRAGSVQPSR
jgi:tetratricopeptide (TPR) repeat protein